MLSILYIVAPCSTHTINIHHIDILEEEAIMWSRKIAAAAGEFIVVGTVTFILAAALAAAATAIVLAGKRISC